MEEKSLSQLELIQSCKGYRAGRGKKRDTLWYWGFEQRDPPSSILNHPFVLFLALYLIDFLVLLFYFSY